MENRLQKAACLVLGIAAAALMICVLFRYLPGGADSEPVFAPAELTVSEQYALIDLNRASEQELQALPGIGETLAERIVLAREETGGFHSKEDVLAVKGIGEATYEKIEPYITY